MKKIVLFLLLLPSIAAFTQNISVSGTVKDGAGEPVPGVFVLCGDKAAVTDSDGKYSILSPSDGRIEFSCIGFVTVIADVSGRTTLDVTIEEDSKLLDEVVVIGYGVQKSKDLTAPIATVKGEELNRQIAGNPLAAMQGKVAGVQITGGGAPGSNPSVKIRGVGSIGDYSSPLYVVDGAFVDNLGFISTTDIEEITVLKDASAAAIYGVRAANGVIIVTTKKGHNGRADISYDGYVGLQTPVNVMKLAGKDDYISLINEANANTTGYVAKKASDYPGDTDWYSTLLRNAVTHSHSLDVSGAFGKSNYSVGVNYLFQDGIMKCDNSYSRLNLRGRFDTQVCDWLKVGMNTIISNYRTVNADTGAYFQAFVNPPVYNVYNSSNTDAYPVAFDSPQLYGFSNSYGNPVARALYNDSRESGLNLVFSTYMELSFLKNRLKVRSSYNLDFRGYWNRAYTPEYLVGGSQGVSTSTLSKSFGLGFRYVIDNTATWSDRKGCSSYSVMVGQSTRIETFSGLSGSATDVPGTDEQAKYIGNGSTKNLWTSDTASAPYRFNGLSFFTRGTWNYDDRYLATVTFRADGSSKYNKKWGFFPSVGFGWVLTGENFLKNQDVVQNLKLRASWGMLGNDSVPANSTAVLSNSGVAASAVFGDILCDGVGAQTVAQNFLKWEVVSELNAGIDFLFFKGRLNGEIDYYNRTTDNVVFYVPVATGGGTTELLSNNGKVRNQGVEIVLGWNDSPTSDISYGVGVNLTTIANKVVSLEGRDYIPGASVRGNFTTRTQVGYPIGSFWGYKIDGVFQNEKDALLDPVYQAIKDAGYFKYSDIDGNKKIDDDDKTFLGSPIPSLLMGLDFSFAWKGFDFSLNLQGQFGNKVLNAKRMNRDVFSDGNYDLDFAGNCWRPGRNSDSYPSAEAYNSGFIQQANSFFVEDASYLRIQNVQAGYTFSNLGPVKSLRIYAASRQPYTFFRYNGFSPEIGGSPIACGIDTSTYPMSATCTLGIKIVF